jgi:hypothetical protein
MYGYRLKRPVWVETSGGNTSLALRGRGKPGMVWVPFT